MKKMLRVLLLPGVLLLLLTSCNTETTHFNYTFKGEGDTWSGVYKQEASQKLITRGDKVSSESSKQYTFDLKYKGKQSDLGKSSSSNMATKASAAAAPARRKVQYAGICCIWVDMEKARLNMRTPSLK
ncbi:hypothetical protein ACFTAO_17510 [Paenibacillus rhizoplanae]